MSYFDIILYVILAFAAVLGYYRGFVIVFKKLTKGIKGLIIFILLCVAFGGFLSNIAVVQDLMSKITSYTSSFPAFLDFIPYEKVALYLVLAILFLLLRLILSVILKAIFGRSVQANVLSRILGLVTYFAFYSLIILVVLAGIKYFDSQSFLQDFLTKIQGSVLEKIYLENPIIF